MELALALYGFQDPSSGLGKSASFGGVFPYVGSKALVATKLGPAPPLVTGTFGSLDLYQSILGEVDDKTAATNLKELDMVGNRSNRSASMLSIFIETRCDRGTSFG